MVCDNIERDELDVNLSVGFITLSVTPVEISVVGRDLDCFWFNVFILEVFFLYY